MRSSRMKRWGVPPCVLASALLACSDSTGPNPPGNGHEDCVPGSNPFDFPMHHQHPTWSCQGLICYEDVGVVRVDSSGLFEIDSSLAGLWVLDRTSGDRQRVVPFGRTPTWSPDGTTIAFSVGQIYTVNADGSGLTQITFAGAHHFPSWSPSADWIAYDNALHVWVMRADGSEPRNIGEVEQPQGSRMPSWNPDGTRIVYVGAVDATFPTSRTEVFLMDVSGASVVRLTTNQTDDRHPVFSPDGNQIAYCGQMLSGDSWVDRLPQVWVMNADGSGARQLTALGGYHPSWSPDGTTIVYTRENAVCNTPENGVLWTVDVRTGVERQLTTKWPERSP